MKAAVIGGGAIGLLLTHRLTAAGADVFLVTRTQRQADQICEKGIAVTELDGAQEIRRCRAYGAEAEIPERASVLFLTVKQTQVRDAVPLIRRLLEKDGCLICLQNGAGHLETLSRYFRSERVLAAVTLQGAWRLDPRSVRHTGKGDTWIEERPEPAERLQTLVNRMRHTTFPFRMARDIQMRMWKKLAVNCVINPLTVYYRCRNGELCDRPERVEHMRAVWREVRDVLRAAGADLPEEFWQEIVRVCRNTAGNKSSMLQDIEAGRATEIDYLNGYIIRLANTHHIRVEENQKLLSAVRRWEPDRK